MDDTTSFNMSKIWGLVICVCVWQRETKGGGADIGTQTGRGRDGGVMETWIYVYMYVHFPGINTRPLRETWFMLFYRLDLINFYIHVTTRKKKKDTKKISLHIDHVKNNTIYDLPVWPSHEMFPT